MRVLSVLLASALLFAPLAARAQTTATPPSAAAPLTVRPADVASPETIVAALYEVISGDAGVARDWGRFRSLFHPTAGRLMAVGRTREGETVLRVMTPDDYVARNGPMLVERGFHERELARRTERWGRNAHVFSTYEAKARLTDATPLARGTNSIQLFDDGTRWWVVSVYWQAESPDQPLPAEYLPKP